MNHPYSEADIIRYLRDQMDEIELDSFLKEMNSNQALEEDVIVHKIALQEIAINGELFMKERFKKIESKIFYKKWFAIVAFVIAAILIAFVVKNLNTTKDSDLPKTIYAQHFEKYRPPITIRNSDSQNSKFTDAIIAYKSDNFEEAFLKFNSVCDDVNKEACFYACLSAIYSEENTPQKAREIISQNEAYYSILLWNEALILIKNEDIKSAKAKLIMLIQKGNYKTLESQSILDQLNKTTQ